MAMLYKVDARITTIQYSNSGACANVTNILLIANIIISQPPHFHKLQ